MSLWTDWVMAWDGKEERPEGVIPDKVLPCSSWMYKYVIHLELILSSSSATQDWHGFLTHHVGKKYKETIQPVWRTTFCPPFCVFQYLDDKEKRIFYKWMNLKNLNNEYKDYIQKEQILEFKELIIKNTVESGIDCKVDFLAHDISKKNTLYSTSFISTGGVQNVARDLLIGEELEIKECSIDILQGKKFEIIANDGFGNITVREIIVNNKVYYLNDLPLGTKLSLTCKYGWVEIGIHEAGKYNWYGPEKYSIYGEGYFISSGITGISLSLSSIPLDGELGSPMIDVPLQRGDRIWIDQHNIGIPSLGKRGAVYWVRSRLTAPGLKAIHKKDCFTLLASVVNNGALYAKEIGFKSDGSGWHYQNTLIDGSMTYNFPSVIQTKDLDLHFTVESSGKIYIIRTTSALVDKKIYEVCEGTEPKTTFDEAIERIYLLCKINSIPCLYEGSRTGDRFYFKRLSCFEGFLPSTGRIGYDIYYVKKYGLLLSFIYNNKVLIYSSFNNSENEVNVPNWSTQEINKFEANKEEINYITRTYWITEIDLTKEIVASNTKIENIDLFSYINTGIPYQICRKTGDRKVYLKKGDNNWQELYDSKGDTFDTVVMDNTNRIYIIEQIGENINVYEYDGKCKLLSLTP